MSLPQEGVDKSQLGEAETQNLAEWLEGRLVGLHRSNLGADRLMLHLCSLLVMFLDDALGRRPPQNPVWCYCKHKNHILLFSLLFSLYTPALTFPDAFIPTKALSKGFCSGVICSLANWHLSRCAGAVSHWKWLLQAVIGRYADPIGVCVCSPKKGVGGAPDKKPSCGWPRKITKPVLHTKKPRRGDSWSCTERNLKWVCWPLTWIKTSSHYWY